MDETLVPVPFAIPETLNRPVPPASTFAVTVGRAVSIITLTDFSIALLDLSLAETVI